jgi:hypothetical protein
MADHQRRPGRPPKYAADTRSNINFRISNKTRALLAEAAKQSGRSLSAQIEHCIEYALLGERTLGDLKEYERRAKRAIDIQTGAAALPGGFITEEQAKQLVRNTLREMLTPPKQQTDADLLREIEDLRARVDNAMQKKRDEDAA